MIADDKSAEGIAGIIGGEHSGCSETTKNVFMEAAYFDPLRTAATGRKLGVISDARYRFERGVDPAFTQVGAEIATQMILELCGGAASHLVIAGKVPLNPRTYHVAAHAGESHLAGLIFRLPSRSAFFRDLGFGVKETAGGT